MARVRRGADSLTPTPRDMDALFREVDAASRTDPRRALTLVERLLRPHRAHPRSGTLRTRGAAPIDGDDRARLIRMRAHVRRNLNDYAGALDDYRTALDHYRRTGNGLERAITQIGRVDALMYRGRYDEALRAAAEARRVFLRRGEVVRAARLDANVGNLYHRWDRPLIALKHYERARDVFVANEDLQGIALTEFNRGNVLSVLGRFAEADAAYRASRVIFDGLGLELASAQVEYNRAYLPFLEERLTDALAAFDRVQPRLGRLGERRHESLCLMDSAEILLRLNQPVEAEERARRAAAGFRGLDLRYEHARSLAFQGTALVRLGRHEAARRAWRRSAALFAREKNTLWQGILELGQARLELSLERLPATRRRLAAARAHLARPGTPRDRHAELRLVEGLAAAARGDDPSTCFREARRLARAAQATWLVRDIEEALGDNARREGRGSAAHRHYAAAVDAGEALRALVSGDDFRATFFRDRARPYLALAFLELESGRAVEAWDWMERGRARALLEELDDLPRTARRVSAPRAAELEALLRRLAAQYHRDQHAALGTRPASEAARLPDTVRRHLESRAESLVRTMHPDWPGNATRTTTRRPATRAVPAPPVGLPLQSNEAFIGYVEFDGAISAFQRTREGVRVATDLADTATIEAAVERLTYQWGRFRLGPELFRRHGEALLDDTLEDLELLHGLLVAPLRESARSPRWIVSPSRSLATIPLAALYDGRQFAIEARSVTVTPSLGVFARCRSRVTRALRRAILLGQAGADAPEVGRELSDIGRHLAGVEVRRLDGREATVGAFLRAAREADYIHLASHGFFHAERPRLSGIRLADRWLHAHDVAGAELGAQLVVLSACQSGLAQATEGEDWLGLARAFLKAGAARVLASLWDVEDRATRELMTEFARELGSGQSRGRWVEGWGERLPSEALRRAQIEILARHRHPYFWAGFQLVGTP